MEFEGYVICPVRPEEIDNEIIMRCVAVWNTILEIEMTETECMQTEKMEDILTNDPQFLDILDIARNTAKTSATILIQGESGTGKELLSRYIHQNSERKGHYIPVNCAALPEALAESELFGHEKGAFTGAFRKKLGKFELADNGTIVLDEITELSPAIQAKLLRILQEKRIDRVGGYQSFPVDFRLIAVSNIDLRQAVLEAKFREDLYYRINVLPLTIPPLRHRTRDIPILMKYFIEKYSMLYGKHILSVSDRVVQILINERWNGNVRELENTIERAVLLTREDRILSKHLSPVGKPDQNSNVIHIRGGSTIKEMEEELIFRTLEEVKQNRTRAAQRLGISIRTLRNKIKDYREKEAPCKKVSII
jgi:transcriptional regulator with PAS, ATPase and Fis domain